LFYMSKHTFHSFMHIAAP